MKVERDYLGKRYTFIPASKEDEKFLDVFNKYIDELEEENKNLKEKLSEITMVSDDDKQSIEYILELEQENKRLSEKNKIYSNALVQEKEDNKTLKEENETLYKKLQEIGENNFELEQENKKLSEGKIIYASEKEQRHYVDILEENQKLKEANKNLIIQRDAYCKDYEKIKEENQKLRSNIEFLHSGEGYSCMERIDELEKENKNLNKDKDKWKYLYFEEVAKCDKLKAELNKLKQ